MDNKYTILQTEHNSLSANYSATLQKYSDEQVNARPAEHKWSLKQMYSHIILSDIDFYLPAAESCINKTAPYKPGGKNIAGFLILTAGIMPPFKFKVAKIHAYTSCGNFSKQQLEKEWVARTGRMNGLIDKLATSDPDYKLKHFTLGHLNAYEWLKVCLIHTQHHLKQKAEIEAYLNTRT